MTTYILLRNNKETAPCSLEELRNLGLRADDQVWVEGQSVCWLKPGQIPELKNLVGLAPLVTEIPPITLEEIKARHPEKIQKKTRNFPISPQIWKAGLYTGLILLGIIAGILIRKSGGKKDPVLVAADKDPIPNEIANNPAPAMDSATINFPENTTNLQENGVLQVTPVETGNKDNRKIIPKTLVDPLKLSTTTAEKVPVLVSETMSAKEEKKEEENPGKKISANEIRSQVSIKTNDYSVGSFGGIKNLKLTITNNSKYELDKVAVEIQYLKPLDEFLRSEIVSVQSLAPGETKTIEVKKSSRGVKVNCKVSSIQSKDFSDETAGR